MVMNLMDLITERNKWFCLYSMRVIYNSTSKELCDICKEEEK